jgi:hypothetical protein
VKSNDVSTASKSTIEQGRMALEVLRSLEVAAKCHAATMELQLALAEAESGNPIKVSAWLAKHRDLMSEYPELQHQLASPPHFATAGDFSFVPLPSSATDPSQASEPKLGEPENPPSDIYEVRDSSTLTATSKEGSPWAMMIAGARERNKNSSTELNDFAIVDDDPVLLIDSTKVEVGESVSPKVNVSESVPEIRRVLSPELILALEPKSKKDELRTWRSMLAMSPFLLASTIAHVVVLVVGSAYVIRIAAKTEPKAIVASAVDTQEVSMEAPVEFDSAEVQELDVSQPTIPNLPSFAAASSEPTSSAIQLPTSVVGVGLPSQPVSAGDSAQQAAAASSKNQMPANAAQFFGVKAAGNTFCYVVDASGSMRYNNAFAAAKGELIRSLSALKPKQRYHIMFFSESIVDLSLDGVTPEAFPVYATPDNIQKTIAWIERVKIEKGASPNKALERAIHMDPDGIFLLFDGETTVDVPTFLRKVNRSNDIITGDQPLVPIHTLGFYNEEHQELMRQIAQENLGTFRFVPSPNPKK